MFALKAIKKIENRVADHWTRHNVTLHKRFSSRDESLEYFHWRCDQYPGYLDLMPVKGFDNQSILDFGCGPGHDLVGFLEYSKPAWLVGADVSASSLEEAKERLTLHDGEAELVMLDPGESHLPFEDRSFDYIHASGVLHHLPNLAETLAECHRVLKPNGKCRVMIYNYNSLWLHLYVAYTLQLKQATIPADLPIREAFTRSTDGADCPISNCYTAEEFSKLAAVAGFNSRLLGAAVSLFEADTFAKDRYAACMDQRLAREHREFLLALTYDEKGRPLYQGVPAGVDLVLELSPR